MGFDWLSPKNYKRHYICLSCKKGFKRPSKQDMKHLHSGDFSNLMNDYYDSQNQQDIVDYINATYQKLKVVCPNCTNEMIQVHYNFEVPAQRDKKAWEMIQKEMSSKTDINYTIYLKWHQLELKKQSKNSDKLKLLQENLSKLERQNKKP